MDILEKALANAVGRRQGLVEVDVLSPTIVRAHPQHVAFIGDDIDEFVLTVETTDGGIAFAHFLARLDREAKRWRLRELKAGDGMRHPGRTPVVHGEVDPDELGQAHGARLPAWGVVRLG